MRFLACSVAFLLITAGVAVLTGCIPITEHRGKELFVRPAEALKRDHAGEADVRAAFGEPRGVQPIEGGGRRLAFRVPVSKRTSFLTLCGVMPMQDWTTDFRQLSVDVDASGRVRDYRLE
jgi:hypothetical protein